MPKREPWMEPLEEIWEIRRRLLAEFGNDLSRYGAHLMELRERYRDRLVEPPATKRDDGEAVRSVRQRKRESADPVIGEIHATRRRIAARFGNDPARLIEHFIEYDKELDRRLAAEDRARSPEKEKPAA